MLLAKVKLLQDAALLARVRLVVAFLVLFASTGCAGQLKPACFARLPVYDAKGNHLQFRIVGVETDDQKLDLLRLKKLEYRVVADGEILYFPRTLIGGNPLRVALEDTAGRRVYGRLYLLACEQRTSFRFGQQDTGFDVRASIITGRLSGCEFTRDWWIRATPMFGEPERSMTFEGHIRPDGAFSIEQSMEGVRYVIVVGKGNQPVKVFAVDVVVGGKNDAGEVNLSGLCPK